MLHLKQCVLSISEEVCRLEETIQRLYERTKEQLQ
jgi:hypothetical protein